MNGQNPIVSIIIPIYNAEKYLKECIDSVCQQTYKSLDIILVDDGSQDDSPSICDGYHEDSRVTVLHVPNKGVSAARNIGLKAAIGEYVVFVDADDILERDIIEKAVAKAGKTNKLVQWNYIFLKDKQLEKAPPIYGDATNRENLLATVIGGYTDGYFLGQYFRAVWGKLLRRDIITQNGLAFDEKLYIGEDALFLIEYLQYVDGVTILNEYGYLYRITSTSAVRKFKRDLDQQSIYQLQKIEDLLKKEQLTDTIQYSMATLSWAIYNAIQENYIIGKKQTASLENAYPFLKKWSAQNQWLRKPLCTHCGTSRYVCVESFLFRHLPFSMVFILTVWHAYIRVGLRKNY